MFITIEGAQLRPFQGDQRNPDDTSNSSRNNTKWNPENAGNDPGLNFKKLLKPAICKVGSPDGSVLSFDELFCDGEAKSQSFDAGLFRAVKAIKDEG